MDKSEYSSLDNYRIQKIIENISNLNNFNFELSSSGYFECQDKIYTI